jgi:hypothetical protein
LAALVLEMIARNACACAFPVGADIGRASSEPDETVEIPFVRAGFFIIGIFVVSSVFPSPAMKRGE